ncbi:DUF1127 domain-containing protein [Flaviflagellibacter deserti]|uniref:DUF1127 domain-containing protein n=1 Tax=Flaviflagellibacter deserti TaxID=2267266 RepID=A0ABV9Z4U4_9HYPH
MAHVSMQSGLSATTETSSLRDLLVKMQTVWSAVANRYVAGGMLSHLDDRMLSDIGISRGDVESAFAEPVWRDPTTRLALLATERRTGSRELNTETLDAAA